MPDSPMKTECIRLRVEERLAIREIVAKTKSPVGSVTFWIKGYPLTEEEKRVHNANANRYVQPKKDRGTQSEDSKNIDITEWDSNQRGRVAEAAVRAKLTFQGFDTFVPLANDSTEDLIVINPETNILSTIQIRYASQTPNTLPVILLKKYAGDKQIKRFEPGDFDFIVGYDFFSNLAYVFDEKETENNQCIITVRTDAKEAWYKIKNFTGRK